MCDVAAPALEQGSDCVLNDNLEWSWEKYSTDVASNLVCNVASNLVSIDAPKFIRDIKDEAQSLGKRGTKAPTSYLQKAQNEVFWINQGIDVIVSVAETVYNGAFSKIASVF